MAMPSGKKILLFGFVVVLLIAIPLIIYLVSQQKTQTSAVPATSLSLTPSTQTVNVGANTNFDVIIDPGTNTISFVKVYINYDATKLATEGAGFIPNTTAFQSVVQGPVFEPGTISFTLSIGANAPTITSSTKIGTLTFQALSTPETGATQVTFGNQTQVLSVGTTDQFNENLLLKTSLATINITAPVLSPTPTISLPLITPTITPVQNATSSGVSLAAPASAAETPVCFSFTADRALTGIVPYNVNFTLIGTSSADILKATYNFGDGQIKELTQADGIGQTSVNALTSHIYNSSGTFSAFGTITDVNGAVSQVGTCTLILTINPSDGSVASNSGVPNPSPLPPTGPSNFITFGVVGFFIALLGVVLLLAL